MKKEDDFVIKPVIVDTPRIKLSENVITNDELNEYSSSPFDLSNVSSNVTPKEESYIRAFFRGELALLRFLPYKNLTSAFNALQVYTGFTSIYVKLTEDLDNSANNLIRGCFLLKFLISVQHHEKDFSNNFFLSFENKLLWDEKRWLVRYFKNQYKFVIRSGAQNPSGALHSQVYALIREVIAKFPRLRAEDLLYRIYRIAQSETLDDGL